MNGDLGNMHDGYCYHCGKGYCTDFGGPGGETCYGCGQCVDKPEPEVAPSRNVTDEEFEAMINSLPLSGDSNYAKNQRSQKYIYYLMNKIHILEQKIYKMENKNGHKENKKG